MAPSSSGTPTRNTVILTTSPKPTSRFSRDAPMRANTEFDWVSVSPQNARLPLATLKTVDESRLFTADIGASALVNDEF